MREMVLNHASLAAAGRHQVAEWLPEAVDGMATLVAHSVTQGVLRMYKAAHEIRCQDGQSWFDACLNLNRRGARDQYLFLVKLSTKAPLLSGVAPDIAERFCRCEAKRLPPDEGAPLVLCAISDAVAVSMPSEPVWDQERVLVVFDELSSDAELSEAEEEIDNLARSSHAPAIRDRHRERLRRHCSRASDLWRRREDLFPHLTFGPDVEDHLAGLNAGLLVTLANRLADLDDAAARWTDAGGDAPQWRTRVTPESRSTMENPRLREARRFRSATGERVLFEWHARFGSSDRIHLRFDAASRDIEIGYIGGHLPLG